MDKVEQLKKFGKKYYISIAILVLAITCCAVFIPLIWEEYPVENTANQTLRQNTTTSEVKTQPYLPSIPFSNLLIDETVSTPPITQPPVETTAPITTGPIETTAPITTGPVTFSPIETTAPITTGPIETTAPVDEYEKWVDETCLEGIPITLPPVDPRSPLLCGPNTLFNTELEQCLGNITSEKEIGELVSKEFESFKIIEKDGVLIHWGLTPDPPFDIPLTPKQIITYTCPVGEETNQLWISPTSNSSDNKNVNKCEYCFELANTNECYWGSSCEGTDLEVSDCNMTGMGGKMCCPRFTEYKGRGFVTEGKQKRMSIRVIRYNLCVLYKHFKHIQ